MPSCSGEQGQHSGKQQRENKQNSNAYCVFLSSHNTVHCTVDQVVKQVYRQDQQNQDPDRDDERGTELDPATSVVYLIGTG